MILPPYHIPGPGLVNTQVGECLLNRAPLFIRLYIVGKIYCTLFNKPLEVISNNYPNMSNDQKSLLHCVGLLTVCSHNIQYPFSIHLVKSFPMFLQILHNGLKSLCSTQVKSPFRVTHYSFTGIFFNAVSWKEPCNLELGNRDTSVQLIDFQLANKSSFR